MPAGPFETTLVAAGTCIAAASTYFYRAKQTLPFKVRHDMRELHSLLRSWAFWYAAEEETHTA